MLESRSSNVHMNRSNLHTHLHSRALIIYERGFCFLRIFFFFLCVSNPYTAYSSHTLSTLVHLLFRNTSTQLCTLYSLCVYFRLQHTKSEESCSSYGSSLVVLQVGTKFDASSCASRSNVNVLEQYTVCSVFQSVVERNLYKSFILIFEKSQLLTDKYLNVTLRSRRDDLIYINGTKRVHSYQQQIYTHLIEKPYN